MCCDLRYAQAFAKPSTIFKFDPARDMQPALDGSLKVAAARDIVVGTNRYARHLFIIISSRRIERCQ